MLNLKTIGDNFCKIFNICVGVTRISGTLYSILPPDLEMLELHGIWNGILSSHFIEVMIIPNVEH